MHKAVVGDPESELAMPAHDAEPPYSRPLVVDAGVALQRRQELAGVARSFAQKASADNTVEAYRRQWVWFLEWCEREQREALPAAATTLSDYLADRATRGRPRHGRHDAPWKVSTLAQAIAAISKVHELASLISPQHDPRVKQTWAGIRRTLGTAPRRVSPAVLEVLRQFTQVLPDTLIGTRDRALLVIGFAGAFRRSELVALDVRDVQQDSDGLLVTVRRSKTDQEGAGVTLGLPFGSVPMTCPVRTLNAWLQAAAIVDGALFRSVSRHGRVGERLGGRDVPRIIQRAAAAAGLDAARYSGHSLRAGLATSAAKAGKSDRRIMEQGRWGSRTMVDRYVREARLFDDDNAAAGIGL